MFTKKDLKCYPPILNNENDTTISKITVIYRYSDGGYKKEKPSYITKQNCLENFVSIFGSQNLILLADNIQDETYTYLTNKHKNVIRTNFGNGAQTLRLAFEKAMELPDNNAIYFVEDDYLHKPGSKEILLEGINLGADYVTLYDHPDKYQNPSNGGNRYVQNGGELTRVFLSKSTHWKITNSTPMTFATRAKTIKDDKTILWKYTEGTHPRSFKMFLKLRKKSKRVLISSIPSYSTHGETKFLAPLQDWASI